MFPILILRSLASGILSELPDGLRFVLARFFAKLAGRSPPAEDFLALLSPLEAAENKFRQNLSERLARFAKETNEQRNRLETKLRTVLFEPIPPKASRAPQESTAQEKIPANAGAETGQAPASDGGGRRWRLFAPPLHKEVQSLDAGAAGVETFYEHFFTTTVLARTKPVPEKVIEELAEETVSHILATPSSPSPSPQSATIGQESETALGRDRRELVLSEINGAIGTDLRNSVFLHAEALKEVVADIDSLAVRAIEDVAAQAAQKADA